MSPNTKRILSGLGGGAISLLAIAFPQYAVPLVAIGNLLAGAGLITFHDAGHTTIGPS